MNSAFDWSGLRRGNAQLKGLRMPRLTSIRIAVALGVLLLAANAHAQTPPCPDGSEQTFTGTLAWGQSAQIPIALQPCETVSFEVRTSANPYWGAVFDFDVYNSATPATSLYTEHWSAYAGDARHVPAAGWFTTIRGTRGPEGLPGRAVLCCGIWGECAYTTS